MCGSARTWDGGNHDDTAIHDADGDRDPPREARSHAPAEAPLTGADYGTRRATRTRRRATAAMTNAHTTASDGSRARGTAQPQRGQQDSDPRAAAAQGAQ